MITLCSCYNDNKRLTLVLAAAIVQTGASVDRLVCGFRACIYSIAGWPHGVPEILFRASKCTGECWPGHWAVGNNSWDQSHIAMGWGYLECWLEYYHARIYIYIFCVLALECTWDPLWVTARRRERELMRDKSWFYLWYSVVIFVACSSAVVASFNLSKFPSICSRSDDVAKNLEKTLKFLTIKELYPTFPCTAWSNIFSHL